MIRIRFARCGVRNSPAFMRAITRQPLRRGRPSGPRHGLNAATDEVDRWVV